MLPILPSSVRDAVRANPRFARSFRRRAALLAMAAVCCLCPHPARADEAESSIANIAIVETADSAAKSEQRVPASSGIRIDGWQGAKNCGDSFSITAPGSSGAEVTFLAKNCTVSPSTGKLGGTFRVTVTGAGDYSVTAVSGGDSVQKTGYAGKTDQSPLIINGWGGSKDYYHTFSITLSGGTTNGDIRFEADGCVVSPTSGKVGDVYNVTVTRVGSYSLVAIMAGDRNHSDAISARYSGTAAKSSQRPVEIEGWVETARYGDSFEVQISGGTANEAMVITTNGCSATKLSGSTYEIRVDSVGPYTLTAARPGNYGYFDTATSKCGISKQAYQPRLSITGWQATAGVSDSFPIHVRGGLTDAMISFSTVGCTVSPETGTTAESFLVTVDSVGEYALQAFVTETDCYAGASSDKLSGLAQKTRQRPLNVNNWDAKACSGDSFDVTVDGGSGNGATSLTTLSGCSATLRNGETEVYTVTVTAVGGEPYSIQVNKAGDVNFTEASPVILSGTAEKARQAALEIDGWNSTAIAGQSFNIRITGGSGDGEITFEAAGCVVKSAQSGDPNEYVVTVTALNGSTYSLTCNRSGSGFYAGASVLRSGSVRNTVIRTEASDDMVELSGEYDVWLWCGVFVLLLTILVGLLLFRVNTANKRKRKERRKAHAM